MKPFISFCLLLCICLGKLYAQGVNIVYIGNSITQGALLKTPVTEAPPVLASQYIEQATKQSVAFRNCGVSGTTTLDSNRRKTISECKICRPRIEST